MAISEEEVARLHKGNRPSAQVHLCTDTAKLIIYSFVQCELKFVCRRIYKNYSTVDSDSMKWKVKKGLNVICLCRYAEVEDWPTKYRRVSIEVITEGQVMFLGHAPDLDSRWQTLILTESLLFSLNSSLTRNRSCPLLTKRANGHDGEPMSKDIPFYKAFDWEFSMDYAWHKKWFRRRWRTIMVDPYWKARDTFVPLLDLHDGHDSCTYYE